MEPQLTEKAIEHGGVTLILVVVLILGARYISWVTKNTQDVLKDKDRDIKELNDRRAETANAFCAATMTMRENLEEVIELLKDAARREEAHESSRASDGEG
jgi:hypothetical protein